MKEPERYDGANDLDVFDDWVLDITRWMAISQLGGPKKEKMRILTLGQLLSKKALNWYRSEIESPFRARREWTFVDIVCGLFDHFVHKTSGKVAGEKFRSVQYDVRKGVSQLYTEMMKHASRMVEVPSEYDQSIVFMNALPEEFRKALRISRKISEEQNTLMEIYYNAMDIEEAIHTDKRQKENKEKPRVEDRNRDYRPPTEDRNREHHSQFEDRNRHNRSWGEGGHHASRHHQSRERERDRSTNRPEGNQKVQASHVKTREEPRRRDEGKNSSSSKATQGTHQRHQEYQPEKKEKEKDGPRISDKSHTLQSNPAIRRVEETPSDSDELDESDSVEEIEYERESSERDTERRRYTRFGRRSPRRRRSESESSYNSDQSLHASVAESEEGYDVEGYGSDESAYTSGGEHATESNHTDGEEDSEDSASFRAMSVAADMSGDLNGDDPLVERRSRPKQVSERLMAYIEINGRKALALFDSGSSIDAIDHEFARVAHMKPFRLRKPVSLRLGTKKNQSRIDFGVYMRMSVNGVEAETYLDIADIGRYDIVFGAPSMLKYGMCLDFEQRLVRIRGGGVIDSISLRTVQEIETGTVETMETHSEKRAITKTLPPQTISQSFGGGGRPSVELPVILKPNTHQVNFHSKFTEIPEQNASNEQREGRSHESSHLRHHGRGFSLVESPRRTCVMQQGASQYTGMPNEEENIPVTPSEMGDYPMQIITDDRTTSGLAKIPKPAPDAIHRHARENANAGVGRGKFGVLEGVIDVAGSVNKSGSTPSSEEKDG
ncbi:hypothetical protein NLI96_g2182 [Meripilus lineatus]|uniref:Retrotransposon gag domain-containing protein n=1 Tax=Meripilus lineatus TaxID=2056292 RepID=A0AAD5V983_9APHY|nr:hypothetical protein NLI96_g2182 [Physisporinus lineatus]